MGDYNLSLQAIDEGRVLLEKVYAAQALTAKDCCANEYEQKVESARAKFYIWWMKYADSMMVAARRYEERYEDCDRLEATQKVQTARKILAEENPTKEECLYFADMAERLLKSYGIAPGQDLWWAVLRVTSYLRTVVGEPDGSH